MKNYDIIIVGAGIAGLYAAYMIKKMSDKTRFLILESSPRKWIGGRMQTVNFRGTSVVSGAGIGRKNKDRLLIELLNSLKVKYTEFPISHLYSKNLDNSCKVKQIFEFLKKHHPNHSIGETFQKYALSFLDPNEYSLFVTCAGYSDYEKEDSYDVLYHYSFEDNYQDATGLSIPWSKLVHSLVEYIGRENIATSSKVVEIEIENENENENKNTQGFYKIYTKNGKTFEAKKIIVATTIDSLRHLFPKNPLYKDIVGQPFLRVYGKFSKDSIPIMQEYVKGLTIVKGPLQKIIPMNPDDGIYMIAYSDNRRALKLKSHLENTLKNREYFESLLEKALNAPKGSLHLTSMIDFYWDVGTHYYKPLTKQFKDRAAFLREAQHPEKNILVVGEMVALNQGWVEGSLDSVKMVLTKSWVK
jgi:hypothetical protein